MNPGETAENTSRIRSGLSTPSATHAVVRCVPETYDKCVRPAHYADRIDVALARSQHDAYCRALESLGIEVIHLESDDRLPDCCFVEDPAVILDDLAIILNLGTPARRGEETEVERELSRRMRTVRMTPPATLEGGDVLIIDRDIYVGRSLRTNREGVEQLKGLLAGTDWRVVPVPIIGALHLKTVCSYLGQGELLMATGHFDIELFDRLEPFVVPQEEAYSANCLSVNGKVLVPSGYPQTRELIERRGFATMELDVSEFRKGDGGLTCLSKLF